MGFRSVVFGHIRLARDPEGEADRHNRAVLQTFLFDDGCPFRNIFHIEQGYHGKTIFIGGTFKDIEDNWQEWFLRFTQFLSALEAIEANVILDCFYGRFAWTLAPEVIATRSKRDNVLSLVGQAWYIIRAPEPDGGFEEMLRPNNTPVRIDEQHLYGS